jgi:hypothetical protein
VISERVVGGVGSFVGFEVAVLPRCVDSQSFSPCRWIGIPVRRVAASCLQRHAQHPPGRRTIVAAAVVEPMRFNDGDALAHFRSLFLSSWLLTYSLSALEPELIRSQILLLSQLAVHSWEFCATSGNSFATVYRWHQHHRIHYWTRLAGHVVGGSQSIHRHLISLGAVSSLSSFGYRDGDDPHRTRRFANDNRHPI